MRPDPSPPDPRTWRSRALPWTPSVVLVAMTPVVAAWEGDVRFVWPLLTALCLAGLQLYVLSVEKRTRRLREAIHEGERARSELTRARALLEAAVEHSPAGILLADAPDGRIRMANSAALGIRGSSEHELTDIPLEHHPRNWGVYHPDGTPFQPEDLPLSRAVLYGETSENVEAEIRRPDGESRYVLANAAPVRDEEGQVMAGIVVFPDITERKVWEDALEVSEKRFRALFEFAPDALFLTDLSGKVVDGNKATAELLGLRPAEWHGRNLMELGVISRDQASTAARHLARSALGRSTGPDELVIVRPGGERVRAELRSFPLSLQDQHLVLCIARDITDRHEAEKALRRSEARLRAFVEGTTYGIYRSTPEGRFVSVNPALVEMLGYDSASELMSVDIGRDVYAEPGRRESLVRRYRDRDGVRGVEAVWLRKDGSEITVRLGGRPVKDDSGRVTGFEMVAEDVTEQKRLEEQLRQSQKMEAVGQLTGGIAHDFNNILSVILLHAEQLRTNLAGVDRGLSSAAEEISQAAARAAEVTRQLLGFSRRATLAPEPTDLAEVVTRISVMLQRVLPEDIDLTIQTEPRVPLVEADSGAVEQMIVNLVNNARDAMPQGGSLTITVRTHSGPGGNGATPEYGRFVAISVADDGEGMAVEIADRIFEPFFTTKPVGQGTGLGMAMVYGLIQQHKGLIDVESFPGQGTRVSLYFPTLQDAERPAPQPSQAARPPRGEERVLLVEDEDMLRRVGRTILERHGYRVVTAAHGEEALDAVSSQADDFDLVVTDIVMPRMGGVDLFHTLRERGCRSRFLFATGYPGAMEGGMAKGLDPSDPFIQKPWKMQEFLHRVRAVLDQD